MNFISAFILVAGLLPAALSQESSGNYLRAAQSHLERKLSQSLDNLETELAGRLLANPIQTNVCKAVEQAFTDTVTCTCAFKASKLKLKFNCTGSQSVDVASGLTGIPQYSGTFDLSPPKVGSQIKADVCILKAQLNGMNFGDLCFGGGICLKRGQRRICGCHASGGDTQCLCSECGLMGLKVTCTGINLPDVCLPIPFVGSTTPAPKSVAGIGST